MAHGCTYQDLNEDKSFNVYFDVKESTKWQFFTVSWTGEAHEEEFIYLDFTDATLSTVEYDPNGNENQPSDSSVSDDNVNENQQSDSSISGDNVNENQQSDSSISDDNVNENQQSDSSVSGDNANENQQSDSSVSGDNVNENQQSDSSISGDNANENQQSDSSVSGDDIEGNKQSDSSITGNDNEKEQTSQSEAVEYTTQEKETPTKVHVPSNEGLAVFENCDNKDYKYGCIAPNEVATYDLSKFTEDLTIIIGSDLLDAQTFNFSKFTVEKSITIIGDSTQKKFTIMLRDYEFYKLIINNIKLSFNTSLTSFFQCKELSFTSVDVQMKCHSVILSNIKGFNTDNEAQIDCFKEETIDKPPPTTLVISVKDDCKNDVNEVDDSVVVQCLTKEMIPTFDFSKNGSSINMISIYYFNEVDKKIAFNFETVPKSSTVLINGEITPCAVALDITKVGTNIDTLSIANVDLSFITDDQHHVLQVNKFILSKLQNLDESSKQVNISLIKNLDFDKFEYYDAFMKDDGNKDSVTVPSEEEKITSILVTKNGLNITYSSGDTKEYENSSPDMIVKVNQDTDLTISADKEEHSPRRVTIETGNAVTIKVDADIPDDITFGVKSPLDNSGGTVTFVYPKYVIPLFIEANGIVIIKVDNQNTDVEDLKISQLFNPLDEIKLFVPVNIKNVLIEKVQLKNDFSISSGEPTNSKNLKADQITAVISDLAIGSFSSITLSNPVKITKSLNVDVLGKLDAPSIEFTTQSEILVTYYKGKMHPYIFDANTIKSFPATVNIVMSDYTQDESPEMPTLFKIVKLDSNIYESVNLVDKSQKYEKKYYDGHLAAVAIVNKEANQENNNNEEVPTSKGPNVGMIIGIVIACIVVVVVIILVVYFCACKEKGSSSSSSSSSVSSI